MSQSPLGGIGQSGHGGAGFNPVDVIKRGRRGLEGVAAKPASLRGKGQQAPSIPSRRPRRHEPVLMSHRTSLQEAIIVRKSSNQTFDSSCTRPLKFN